LTERPSAEPKRDRYIYYPGTASVPEVFAVNVRNRSYKILVNVEITDVDAGDVIFAHGSRFGGHALSINDKVVAEGPMKTQSRPSSPSRVTACASDSTVVTPLEFTTDFNSTKKAKKPRRSQSEHLKCYPFTLPISGASASTRISNGRQVSR
jgi:hypothetical protein